MNIGMLWFDNDVKADLNVKIERAAHYYQKKYGKAPTLCYVHPSMIPGEALAQAREEAEPGEAKANGKKRAGGKKKEREEAPGGAYARKTAVEQAYKSGSVEVRPAATILPNHFWIGLNSTINSGAAKM